MFAEIKPGSDYLKFRCSLLTQRKIRRDLLKYLHTYNKGDLLAAAERLRSFDRPALVIWAAEDRVMPLAHGRRLVDITDSYTLIPEDQPAQLAAHIRTFIASEPVTAT
jgi:pimeloyl-ACP methyl ester carboxylesterase